MMTWRTTGCVIALGCMSTWQATPPANPGAQVQHFQSLGGIRTWQATQSTEVVTGAQLQGMQPLGGMRLWQATPVAVVNVTGAQVLQYPAFAGMRFWQATPGAVNPQPQVTSDNWLPYDVETETGIDSHRDMIDLNTLALLSGMFWKQ